MQQRKRIQIPIPREAQLKYMQNKRQMKDIETFQVTALLTLLSPYCGFVLEYPRKQTIVTATLPLVQSLVFPNETINLGELAENVCRPAFELNLKKGMKRDSAIRRYEKNRRTFIHNFLFDILLEKSYFFNSKLSRKTMKTFRFERIETIFFEQKPILNFEEMIILGKNAMSFFANSFNEERSIYIDQNNTTLLSLHPLFNTTCSLHN
ncbi:hypothetical protein EDI_055900 [Entamoeba dispar SAW760]|uniref:Uncharacterized protein n=1 Tax=Entamoeba dispar (strain ATCC PRA-260 / SAW760) TaxID=370354 RepID=B0EIJ1_ENTDS|nr:uncharacterized protein EDI_055900 [Entamoeba dispar SAW760]EDR25644.1 hypothetical protein EDI_055900 [Entamoeba dispar SAW760]|eukprot:EDR25644.1 hypothetical protein EDI_055900 [Entamoeba dispar SAW760]